jgi:hypothetical protein
MLFLLFSSCKKSLVEETISFVPPPKLEVKNGVIAFADDAAFESAMKYFHQVGLDETHKIIKQLPNFKSLIEITPNDIEDISRLNKALWKLEDQQIMPMNFDDDVHPGEALEYDDFLIQDPYYQAILNTYREVMVSDLIIRSTEYGVFGYEPEGKKNFETMYETTEFNQALNHSYTMESMNGWQEMQVVLPDIYLINRDIELFDNFPIYTFSVSCNGGTLAKNIFGQLQNCDEHIDNRRRIRATTFAQNLGLYSSIGFNTRRQTRFLRIWWNTTAERLSVEGEGYYSTKWPSGLVSTDYHYNRPNSKVDEPNVKKVKARLPQPWHTATIDFAKPTIKFAKKYEFKKHESDHAGWQNSTRYSIKVKHN